MSNPRSTIGTLTGIEAALRIFFARAGHATCPACLKPVDHELYCKDCGCFAEPLTPQQFSPNRKEGMCLNCNGMGKLTAFSEDKIIPDPTKTLTWIWDNAENGTFSIPNVRKAFEALCKEEGIPLDIPYENLSAARKRLVMYGSKKTFVIKVRKVTNTVTFDGIIGYMDKQYRNTTSASRQQALERYLGEAECTECHGGRLRKESLAIKIQGCNFQDILELSIQEVINQLEAMREKGTLPEIVSEALRSIVMQCEHIRLVGLGYLSLARLTASLSGGELQRILLAQHIASDLTGVMYILDEPSIGLHEHDTGNLLEMLRRLRDLGNSVIVIEHDESIIRAADWIIEVGPRAGREGGRITFQGSVEDMLRSGQSLTAKYMSARTYHHSVRTQDDTKWIEVKSARRNNLQNLCVTFPLSALTCVTGVSGAGKSSLVNTLYENALRSLSEAARRAKPKAEVTGLYMVEDVIYVDQKPIGRSSRSTIATYLDINDEVRDLYAALPDATVRGFDKSHFSTNVPGGRCEKCKGQGNIEVDMYFLKNEFVVCDECQGRQFQDEVLAVQYQEMDIHEVLELSADAALKFFNADDHPRICQALTLLNDFGLSYLTLGQSTLTLSGGEGQRINLAAELLKQKSKRTLFIFDEPTRGLHFADIEYLLKLFAQLVEVGHTVVIIEHNLDVISHADHIIDLGPEGGDKGGQVVYHGPVTGLLKSRESFTGRCLTQHLKNYYEQPERLKA